MHNFINAIIDFLFPPSAIELRLREISPTQFPKNVSIANTPEFPFIKSLFSYKDPLVRELIWQIKYKKNKHAIKCAGFALYSELLKQKEDVLLIPIPISNRRKKERGYNQCELIVDEIMRLDTHNRLRRDYCLLIRNKNIDKQTFKNRSERIKNTKNIFEVTDATQIHKNIVIIDDVTTTGSTLRKLGIHLFRLGIYMWRH